ncbi:uncharacterized protein LOC134080923 [Sardina pilchardus]|uniref:uncharacterized protein LOC134080923 n=1 Tax=Sardina pilchardus TaxID=27697 RepID=UPI002E0EA10E
MPKSCCVVFCTANKQKNYYLKFYILPNIETEPERRIKWLQAIRREDDKGKLWDPKSRHVYVCSRHFITGLKSDREDHPDYIPSVFPKRRTQSALKLNRLQRLINRSRKKLEREVSQQVSTPETPEMDTDPVAIESQQTSEHELDTDPVPIESQQTSEHELDPVPIESQQTSEHDPVPIESQQTPSVLPTENELLVESTMPPCHHHGELEQLHEEIMNLRRERDEARQERLDVVMELERVRFSANSVKGNDEKCKEMTGLSWTLFETLHQFLVQFVLRHPRCKLSTQDQLFITLLKLRQNPSTDLMCYILNVARSTFLGIFSRWLDLMYAKISFLIAWPHRECIRSTVPAEVLLHYPRLTSIVDCFEIRIEHSKQLKTSCKSNYILKI